MKIFTHILFTVFLLFCSCNNTSEEGIENSISDFVQSSLPDTWTYEPIAYSVTDSAMSKVEDTKQYQELVEAQAQLDSTFIYDKAIGYYEEMKDLKSKFTPHYIGKKIIHAYLCSTDFGDSLFINTYIVGTDGDITKSNSTSVYVSSPDSVRMESIKKQLKQFLDQAVKWK
jgi:hypothetical protein